MKSYLQELQHDLIGTVTDSQDALDYFSTDGSVFTITPSGVVYPQNTQDVQATVRFVAERAASGKKLSITARGKGTDQGGAAINDGLIMAFTSHMNRLLKNDKKSVTVQPGMTYGSLQKILHSHGRFLPPYPASLEFSTIGGAVANNAAGEKTIKYGATRQYVEQLKVVLSDGSTIETKRLTSRALSKKKSLKTLEGEIYRKLDTLIVEHASTIHSAMPKTSKNSSGYALSEVKRKDGSFDLSQLITGSQGTLGIVTEVSLKTLPFLPKTVLVVGFFDDLAKASHAVLRLSKLGPSAVEVVDYHLLNYLRKHHPGWLDGLLPAQLPRLVLLVEFDDTSHLKQNLKSRQALAIMKKFASSQKLAVKPAEQQELWKIRRNAAAVIWMAEGKQKALPVIEDATVPVVHLELFLNKTYALLKKHGLSIAIWGHAGNANFHIQPFMDLSKDKDQAALFKLADEFYNMVISMGGSISGEHNDGLLRSPYLTQQYGKEMYELFRQVKQLFDPHNIFNPGKKTDVDPKRLKSLLRKEYSLKHLYDHVPHN